MKVQNNCQREPEKRNTPSTSRDQSCRQGWSSYGSGTGRSLYGDQSFQASTTGGGSKGAALRRLGTSKAAKAAKTSSGVDSEKVMASSPLVNEPTNQP